MLAPWRAGGRWIVIHHLAGGLVARIIASSGFSSFMSCREPPINGVVPFTLSITAERTIGIRSGLVRNGIDARFVKREKNKKSTLLWMLGTSRAHTKLIARNKIFLFSLYIYIYTYIEFIHGPAQFILVIYVI